MNKDEAKAFLAFLKENNRTVLELVSNKNYRKVKKLCALVFLAGIKAGQAGIK